MKCRMCGYAYEETGCSGCGNEGCGVCSCPACGYSEAPPSKIASVINRFRGE